MTEQKKLPPVKFEGYIMYIGDTPYWALPREGGWQVTTPMGNTMHTMFVPKDLIVWLLQIEVKEEK